VKVNEDLTEVPSSPSQNADAYWLGQQNDWVCAMLDFLEAGGEPDGLDEFGRNYLTKAAGVGQS
jgi:hypothetical protein